VLELAFTAVPTATTVLIEAVSSVREREALIDLPVTVIIDEVTGLSARGWAKALTPAFPNTDLNPFTAPVLIAHLTGRARDVLVDQAITVLVHPITALLCRGLRATAYPPFSRVTGLLSKALTVRVLLLTDSSFSHV
jgi:hypothetical protein